MSEEQTVAKQADEKFCSSCGAVVKIAAEICPKCGIRQNAEKSSSKSNWTTLFYLSFWLGFFGIDRFYVGKIGTGILKLITLGGLGIWWFIDLCVIAGGKFTDASGKFVEKQGKAIKHVGICIVILVLLLAIRCQGTDENDTSSDSVITTESKKEPEKIVPFAELSATTLLKVYEDNEVAADNEYKGKWIKVSGNIESIGKNILDKPYVALKTGKYEIRSVQIFFEDNSKLGELKKGQNITVVGRCMGLSMNILIKDAFFE